jgi:hypothetical protein
MMLYVQEYRTKLEMEFSRKRSNIHIEQLSSLNYLKSFIFKNIFHSSTRDNLIYFFLKEQIIRYTSYNKKFDN